MQTKIIIQAQKDNASKMKYTSWWILSTNILCSCTLKPSPRLRDFVILHMWRAQVYMWSFIKLRQLYVAAWYQTFQTSISSFVHMTFMNHTLFVCWLFMMMVSLSTSAADLLHAFKNTPQVCFSIMPRLGWNQILSIDDVASIRRESVHSATIIKTLPYSARVCMSWRCT